MVDGDLELSDKVAILSAATEIRGLTSYEINKADFHQNTTRGFQVPAGSEGLYVLGLVVDIVKEYDRGIKLFGLLQSNKIEVTNITPFGDIDNYDSYAIISNFYVPRPSIFICQAGNYRFQEFPGKGAGKGQVQLCFMLAETPKNLRARATEFLKVISQYSS